MPTLYKTITAVLAFTGCLSILITGHINPLMITAGAAMAPGYYRYFRNAPPAPRWLIGSLSTLTLLVFLFDSIVVSADVFLAVAHLTITFQGLKSFDLKEPWDHLQVFFMALLQLIIASEMTQSLLFAGVFILFLCLMVAALVLSHYVKEGVIGRVRVKRPLLAITGLTLLLTTLIFMLIPRTPQRFIGKGHARGIKTAGFSERVDFGSFGEVKLDPTVVMRIVFDRRPAGPFYWRGVTMDTFDGRTWRQAEKSSLRVRREGSLFRISGTQKEPLLMQQIYLEPIDTSVLFGLPVVAAVVADAPVLVVDSASSLSLPGSSGRRLAYRVLSDADGVLPGRREERYLQLPAGMDRIVELGQSLTSRNMTDRDRAQRIADHLRTSYRYSLTTQPPPDGMSAVEDFLFTTRAGYCEHYASAMVVMLRGLGIPARIVNGFVGGEWNDFGEYLLVRQSDAHSWVEALVDDAWLRFDPTPAGPAIRPHRLAVLVDSLRMAWARYVVGFSSADQRELLAGGASLLRRLAAYRPPPSALVLTAAILLALAAAGALRLLLSRWIVIRRRSGMLTQLYLRLRRLLQRKGRIPAGSIDSLTSGEIRRRVAEGPAAAEIREFLSLYEEARFSGDGATMEKARRAGELLAVIRKELRRRR